MFYATLMLLILHTPDGREVRINPDAVTSLQGPKTGAKKDDKLFAEEIHCLVGLADGKNVAVLEDCSVIQRMLEESK